MKTFLTVVILFVSILTIHPDAYSQDQYANELSYELRFNENDFERLKAMSGKESIATEEFGNWMARAGNVMIKVTDSGENFDGSGNLQLFVIDSSGRVVSEETVGLRVSTVPDMLGNAMNGGLGRAMTSTGPGSFVPTGYHVPQMKTLESQDQAQKEAIQMARRVIGSSEAEHAIVVMAMPAEQRFELQTSPGVVIFTGSLKDDR